MSSQVNEVDENSQIQIIDRVSNLPLVKSVLGYANDQYGKIKGINPIVNATLTLNEQAVSYFASTAAYILEKQLHVADSIACQGLDHLEAKIPVIKQSPEEIYSSGIEKYNDIKNYGNTRVEGWKQFGYQKVQDAFENQYAQAIIKTVDSAVELTDNAVDHILPPVDKEKEESISRDANLIKKMGNLSDKMRRRLVRNAISQVDNIHKQSQEALQHIKQSVDLIQYTKNLEEAGRQRLNERLTSIRKQAGHLWEELNKEENEGNEKTFEQQLLHLARRATKKAIEKYNQLSNINNFLPENVMNTVNLCSDYAKSVNTQLSQVSNIKDLTDLVLQQISSGAVLLQNLLNKTLSPIFPTLSWVTPKQKEDSKTSETVEQNSKSLEGGDEQNSNPAEGTQEKTEHEEN